MKKNLLLFVLIIITCIITGEDMKVSITAGAEWNHTYWFMKIIPVKLSPQIAVWTADEDDKLIETLFVTEKNSKINREEALPYWGSKKERKEMQITSATPKDNFSIHWDKPTSDASYIYAEVNNSFDYNKHYPNVKGDVDGQPSLIYRAEMNHDAKEIFLEPYGIYQDNQISNDLSKLTGALEILSEIKVEVSDSAD
ncbi:hypothetical protein JEZ13_03850 [bacterium]|nr:hypothetical protein [bacterium]